MPKNKNIVKEVESTDYLFDVETGSIIEAVKNDWRKFKRIDLITLGESLEDILQNKRVGITTINRDDNSQYFEKIIIDYNAESHKIVNNDYFPIRSFFIANSRKSNIIDVLDSQVTVVLYADHPFFKQFFAYRLATLPSKKIEPFLQHQLSNLFNNDLKTFKLELQFILADFPSVLGRRKTIIEDIVNDLFPKPSLSLEISESKTILSANVPSIIQFDNDKLKDIFYDEAINSFINVELYLINNGYFNEQGEWKDAIIKLISLILTLETRGYLKKIPGKHAERSHRAFYRRFFEKRYKMKPFAKQMQPSQIKKAMLPEAHKPIYEFIPSFK